MRSVSLTTVMLVVWLLLGLLKPCSPMGYTSASKNWVAICTDSLGYIVIAAENNVNIWRSTDGGATFAAATSGAGAKAW